MSKFAMTPSATPATEEQRIAGVRAWVVKFRCSRCSRVCTEEMVGKKKAIRNHYWRPHPTCSECQTGELP